MPAGRLIRHINQLYWITVDFLYIRLVYDQQSYWREKELVPSLERSLAENYGKIVLGVSSKNGRRRWRKRRWGYDGCIWNDNSREIIIWSNLRSLPSLTKLLYKNNNFYEKQIWYMEKIWHKHNLTLTPSDINNKSKILSNVTTLLLSTLNTTYDE